MCVNARMVSDRRQRGEMLGRVTVCIAASRRWVAGCVRVVLPPRETQRTHMTANERLRFSSHVFHNCGKNCGKPGDRCRVDRPEADFAGIPAWRKGLRTLFLRA